MELPNEWLKKLIYELPEIYAFVKEKRPDYKGKTLLDYDSRFSIELSTIASNIEKHRNYESPKVDPFGHSTYTIGKTILGGSWIWDDMSKLGNVDKNIAAELLKRLKEEGEFPELEDIEDWSELNYSCITEDFIQRIISRAHRGNI